MLVHYPDTGLRLKVCLILSQIMRRQLELAVCIYTERRNGWQVKNLTKYYG